jgi:hypothetical protein
MTRYALKRIQECSPPTDAARRPTALSERALVQNDW